MKPRTSIGMTAITLLTVLVIQAGLAAQDNQVAKRQHHIYRLIDLGTFGGPQSYVNIPNGYAPVLNNRGTLTGWADTSTPDPHPNFCFDEDCFVAHAFQSRNGVTTDLGVLPGGASSASDWVSANGLIAGFSENGEIDPLIPGLPEVRAVLWNHRKITDLGALPEGGFESVANAVNSRGMVVGAALNTTPDDNSMFGLGYQTRAFLWQNGVMQDLNTLGGTDAQALLVNERGQVVGESYTGSAPSAYCEQAFGFALTTGAFLWEHGAMKNLGNLGGTCTFATDLNNQGQVAGLSTLIGDRFQHAFLWSHGSINDLRNALGGNNGAAIALNDGGDVVGWASLPGDQDIHAALWKNHTMTDLGSVEGDPCSLAVAVNATGQVVGQSVPGCDFSQSRAFLWESGSMVDLNTLIPSGSSLYLTEPETINDRGEIAGNGLDVDGNQHAFLLIPCDENRAGTDGCGNAADGTTALQNNPAPVTKRPTPSIQQRLAPADSAGWPARVARRYHFPRRGAPRTAKAEPAPTNLSSYAFKRGLYDVVVLSWINHSNDADSNHMERCTGSTCTNFSEIAVIGANATHYIDSMWPIHLTFRYRVRAHGPSGYSGYSNIRTQPTP